MKIDGDEGKRLSRNDSGVLFSDLLHFGGELSQQGPGRRDLGQ